MSNTLTNSQLNSFGIRPVQELDIEKEQQGETEEESDAVNQNASDSETQDESSEIETDEGQDEGQDEQEEKDEQSESDELKKERKKRESAEAQMRVLQSKTDQQQHALQQIYNEFQTLKQQQNTAKSETSDQGIDLDDDDIVDGKSVKKYLESKLKSVEQKPERQKETAPQENFWLSSQTDLDKVSQYVNSRNLKDDSRLKTIPTNGPGMYFAVQSMMKDDEINRLRKENNKLKQVKSKLPTVGGKSSGRGNTNQGKIGTMESQFENMFRKFGMK